MRNTKIHTLLFAFLGVILFTSCEDKIDVELDDAEAIVVIDAFLTDVPGAAQEITVTRSQSYFDSSFPEPITDAFVSISVGSDILIWRESCRFCSTICTQCAIGRRSIFCDRFAQTYTSNR